MFRDLYAAELEYLHGLAEELGHEQSRIAPMLGRDADPGVSRLVQTVAFLSARLRQRLDDDFPDLIHPTLESLHPWLLRPIPSATIVELVPGPGIKEAQTIAVGSAFTSLPIDGAACVFRSTAPAQVRPWSLDAVEIANERTEIRLRLSLLPGAVSAGFSGALRLFFAMPVDAALELRSRILRSTTQIIARPVGAKTEVSFVTLADPLVAGVHAPPSAFDGRQGDALFALRGYFTWPEQFAFVDIPNLGRLADVAGKARAFDVVLVLREALPIALSLDASAIRLHCVPAMNVHAIPMHSAPLGGARCAIALFRREVYAIEQVTLVHDNLSTRPAYPYAGFFPPQIDADGRLPLLYRTDRSLSVGGPELDVDLVFKDLSGSQGPLDAASVDVKLLVTDGSHAARIGLGELCVPSPASPPLVSFRNVTPVTRSAPPALDGDRLWRWFTLLKTPFWQLAERDSLAAVLALANVAAVARWPESKPNDQVFEGLATLEVSRLTRAGRDEIFPGARVEIGVHVEQFAGPGDVDLFGECVADLFASTLRAHEWVELVLRDAKGALLYEYPARRGTRTEL